MCATCGCGDEAGTRVTLLPDPAVAEHGHHHDGQPPHEHDHDHEHQVAAETDRTVVLEQRILAKNASLAKHNRQWLADRGVFAVNLMSSPGSGKTTLLEKTIASVRRDIPIAVIEGDQETPLDGERIRAAGCPVVQINTGAGCHLDADMIMSALLALDPQRGTLLFIENVGNLVCPALFDLGEATRVVLASVTEGSDKPLKYPHMFAAADLVLINKMDLLPYVDFDVHRFSADVHRLNGRTEIVKVTATANDGLTHWIEWLTRALDRGGLADDHLDRVHSRV